ncbi:hypothetical protein MML63_15420 [Kosakonia sacchari]|uniref:hypothetical protein n=1 Tax=Kosakonia sacchari TaxID=1158459 RepID=UPI0025B05D89|nr:hypothetical protein [Kosakonia sacchari]MDN2487021.1 hypothetical protein [Kosakonia sacchari]
MYLILGEIFMILAPEQLNFRISSTDLEVIYTESNGVKLTVEAQSLDDFRHDKYHEVTFNFSNVAEVKCISLNFSEFNCDEYEISLKIDDPLTYWEQTGINPEPGVYCITNSELLRNKGLVYDPNNRLNLKHYLIMGYDSYAEIIASKYEFSGI